MTHFFIVPVIYSLDTSLRFRRSVYWTSCCTELSQIYMHHILWGSWEQKSNISCMYFEMKCIDSLWRQVIEPVKWTIEFRFPEDRKRHTHISSVVINVERITETDSRQLIFLSSFKNKKNKKTFFLSKLYRRNSC